MSADGRTIAAGSVAGASYDTNALTGTIGTADGTSVSWQPPVSISGSNRWVTDGQVLVSQDGKTAVAAWDETTESSKTTVQTSFFASGPVVDGHVQWGAPHTIAPKEVMDVAGDGPAVRLALSADGTHVIVVWNNMTTDGINVESVSGIVDGSTQQWGSTSDFGVVREEFWPTQVSMSADGSKAVVTWNALGPDKGSEGVAVSTASVEGTTASWSKPSTLDIGTMKGQLPYAQQVQVSGDGSTALVAWGTSLSGGSDPVEKASTLDLNTPGSAWTTPATVPGITSATGMPAQIALSTDGKQALAAGTDVGANSVLTSTGTLGANGVTWGTPTTVFSEAPGDTAYSPSIALAGDGRVGAIAIAYENASGSVSEVYAVSGAVNGLTGSWSTPTNLDPTSTQASSPQLAASADGSTVAAVWEVMGADAETLRAATATVSVA